MRSLTKASVVASGVWFSLAMVRYFLNNQSGCQGEACPYVSMKTKSTGDIELSVKHPYWATLVSLDLCSRDNKVIKKQIYLLPRASHTIDKKFEGKIKVTSAINCPRR